MLKNEKKRIQKIIQLLEKNDEDEETLIAHINEAEHIFFKCFKNENKIKNQIINTYFIPYVSLLCEKLSNDRSSSNSSNNNNNNNSMNENYIFKEKLIVIILSFLYSIVRINKNYAYLVVSFLVNLLEEKDYIAKIVEYLKKINIYLLNGLLFSKKKIHFRNGNSNESSSGNENGKNNNKNEYYTNDETHLDNLKQGFNDYVTLKAKVFNMLSNYQFSSYINDNPYKYDIIKNLMTILTKEIFFFFYILK
ncbi:conserved protein, unknown function, partial [Hepatocystis sp. ex Piliocolobus tephrosceles]